MTGGFRFEEGDVLVVVDVLNEFEHADGDELRSSFRERLPTMASVLSQARCTGVPVVYVNDDGGRWDSDAVALVRGALENPRSREIVETLAPERSDRVLLKHKYSAFDHTALDLLLAELRSERVVLIGAATEGCVVQTSIDAREQNLKTTILADACATTSSELEATALRYAADVVGVRVVAWNDGAGRTAPGG